MSQAKAKPVRRPWRDEKAPTPLGEPDDDTTGFNVGTQKLHCLLVLQDAVAEALSVNAGVAFWRGFITEDRKTGDVMAKYRFRYVDHDSWFHLKLEAKKQKWPVKDRVEYLATGMQTVLRMGVEIMAKAPAPEDLVVCFYPPEPDDAEKTFDWLIAQDLVEVRSGTVTSPDGTMEIPVDKEAKA